MLGKIVIRAMLVIALVVTAHMIKPFSMKNIAQHMLISTRSFAFVLPESTRAGFDNASSLALNLSKSLSADNCFTNGMGDEQLLAAHIQEQTLQPAARIWPPDEPIKPAKKSKPSGKRSAPAKRIEKGETNTIAALNASEEPLVALAETENEPSEEIETPAAPVTLPAISEEMINIHALPIGFLSTPDGSNRLAMIDLPRRSLVALQLDFTPKTVAPECEGEKPDTEEAENTAPEPEVPQVQKPQLFDTTEEKRTETETPEERPAPLKCPTQPMQP